jgi:hypothetical protein
VDLPEISRRIFLSRSLRALGAVAALPLLGPGCSKAPGAPVPADLRVFTAGEYAIVWAVADAFVPRGGAFPLGAADVDLAARIDRFLASQDPAIVKGLRGALMLLEYGGGLLAGRPGRFSRMDAGDRAAVLRALPRRVGIAGQVYTGLKQLCLFLFYCAKESWPAIGYDGPWLGREVSAR